MADTQSTSAPAKPQVVRRSSKWISLSETIRCAVCGVDAPRTGRQQLYCRTCSEEKSRARKLKYANAHPPTKDAVSSKGSRKRQRHAERGAELSERERLGVDALFAHRVPAAWHVRLSIPFSYAGSKNHSMQMSRHGHVYLREETVAYRKRIEDEVTLAVKGLPVVTAKVWIELVIQKPNHRGDAINLLDVVADGIKKGLCVDDRWFCVSRLDWQVVKNAPDLLIGIGQDAAEHCRVCSDCGRETPLRLFLPNKGMPGGYGRRCVECNDLGTTRGKPKVTRDDVRVIREASAAGATLDELEARFPLGRPSLRSIISRRTWKEVE